MSLRTRTDRLLEEVGVERTATLNSDVRALAEAVGLGFTSLPATLTALEAEVLGAPAQAAPPAQPAEPAAAPAPAEPAADSDSDGFELTGSQTEAERTAAAREEAERRNAVVDVDDDDDDLAGQSVKTLKAMAAARGVDVSTCREKSEIVAALRAPPPEAIVPAGAPTPAPTAPAPAPAAPPPPPPPAAPQSGAVKRLTRRIISSALKEDASHYDVLGVETSATDRDIKVAYRDIAALIHPDKCSEENATEAFKKVNEANEVLSDAARRSIYDAEQARAAAPAPAEPPSPPAPRRRAQPKRKTPKPKRSKRKAPKRKARAAKRSRKAASDDDDDDFIADSDEEEEESEAEESESDDEDEDDDAPESEPDDDVVGGSDDDDEQDSDDDEDNLAAFTVAQLKAKCEALGLKVSGTKGVLISRLEDAARGIYDRPQPRRAPAAPRRKKTKKSTGSRRQRGSFFDFGDGGGSFSFFNFGGGDY